MKYPDFENGLILFHIFVFFYLCLSSIKLINNSPIHTVHLTLVDSNVCKKSLNAETKPPSPDILQLFITFHYFTIEKKQNFDYNVQGQCLICSESKVCPLTLRFNTLQFDNQRVLSLNTSHF